ncbi:hypothetical protein [Glycomyces tenuis]|uniref:hypothetical protein n=1 Tax=Glycomyces tenuis TaxID=58116 RepID=UPI0003F859DA|nr:hypothetical protein [Glycomyces tenuis]
MAEVHDWHLLDAERGLEVRQTTPDGEGNCWEVRCPDGRVEVLDDDEFEQLRCEGPNPKGLD